MISSKFDVFIILCLFFFQLILHLNDSNKKSRFCQKAWISFFLSKLAKFGKSKFSLNWKFVVVCKNFEQNSEFWQILQTQYCLIFAVICASNFHKSHILKKSRCWFIHFEKNNELSEVSKNQSNQQISWKKWNRRWTFEV